MFWCQQLQEVTPLLMLTGVATTIGCSLPVGYHIGVVNAPEAVIREFCNVSIAHLYGVEMGPSQLNLLWSAVVSIFLIGGMTGSLSGGWVADHFGRKGTIVFSNVIGLVAAALFICSREAGSVELLLLGRLLVGLSSGVITSTNSMYLSEISPDSVRGAMGVLCPFGITVGILISQILGLHNVLGKENTWHYLLALYVFLIIPGSIPLPLLPESPKYLYIVRGQEEKSIRELSRLRGVAPDQLQDEVLELRRVKAAELHLRESGETWTFGRVFSAPALRLPLMLVFSVHIGQQFCGINAVFYYSVSIFESAGLSELTSQYANIGAGCVNLLMAAVAIYLVNRFGRRPLVLFSCCSMAVSLVMLTISITYINAEPWMPHFCIFTVLAYVLCFGCGMCSLPYFIGSELFLVGPRSAGMALGSMVNWGANFIVGITFPSIQDVIGQYSFLFYVVANIILAIFLQHYLPETKGRDLCDVADMLQYCLASDIHDLPLASSRRSLRSSSASTAGGTSASSSRPEEANTSKGGPEKENQ